MIDITSERFFGAKGSTPQHVEVTARMPLDDVEWQLLTVDNACYQVISDGERDVLAEYATAYVEQLPALGEVHGELMPGPATPMGAEQSNTNLIVGNTIVKVFRRLEDGLNPDVELLSRIDNPSVAKVTGYVTRDGRTLAMQQERVAGTDGFELATSGAALDTEALGAAIASVHASLAGAFPTETTRELGAELNARLDRYLERAEVLRDFEAGIRKLYNDLPHPLTIQRVHGDLHLGQTLYGERWTLIDFEGEPARPLAERRRPDHPMRDLAGMVRSFGYARAVGELDETWEAEHVAKLKRGYGDVDETLLAAYIADKAAYEVVYEANNRPDWVGIPLDALRFIL